MTTPNEETEAWLAIRREAAKAIDPATAEVTWEYTQVIDPYGILSEIPDEADCIGRSYFARAPGSDVWVSFRDLPQSVVDELWKRRKRSVPTVSFSPPFSLDLPDVNRLVVEIMARDDGEPGYALAVAKVDNYFGGCPHCGQNDGMANVGKSHWFFCKAHKTTWTIGTNLFSSWREQTEEEQRRIYNEIGLGEFTEVRPLPCTDPNRLADKGGEPPF